MSHINSKELEKILQEAKKTMLQTEMLSYSVNNLHIRRVLSDTIIPNFINYITYMEVANLNKKEITMYLRNCVNAFNEIEEYNQETMLMSSKFKVLRDETVKAMNLT
jgi:hypothetical protein|tara:strand:+ start:3389 stop:3709 length:321 start_codon:yes stop_codon:yes gene_type:complete